MGYLEFTAAAFFISGLANFVLRFAVIRFLHRTSQFQAAGSPRTLFYSDLLPLRAATLPRQSGQDRVLSLAYLATWVSFVVFGIAMVVLLVRGPQSA